MMCELDKTRVTQYKCVRHTFSLCMQNENVQIGRVGLGLRKLHPDCPDVLPFPAVLKNQFICVGSTLFFANK